MATLNTVSTRFGMDYVPSSFTVRFGNREIFIGPDCRKRFSPINPILNCLTGAEPGYVELVLFRTWMIVLSKAR